MEEIINKLKYGLQPKGTAPVVRLFLQDYGHNYFDKEFVDSCITEIEKKWPIWYSGLEKCSPLERLAFRVLLDSAYIDLKKNDDK